MEAMLCAQIKDLDYIPQYIKNQYFEYCCNHNTILETACLICSFTSKIS